MSYRYSEQSKEEYLTDGLTILRDLIPASLLADLRREADRGRELARSLSGPQAQRLQPVYKFPDLDPAPFRNYQDLEGLRDAVRNILGPDHQRNENVGVLYEPAELPWATHWHRDWGYNMHPMDVEEFFRRAQALHTFNQINCALYVDGSLWVVPGSHARRDTPEEVDAMCKIPPAEPDLSGANPQERELICSAYARSMPGAVHICLQAGDCAFYRSSGWHIGVYVPYAKRATIHDGFYCAGDQAWWDYVRAYQEKVSGMTAMPVGL